MTSKQGKTHGKAALAVTSSLMVVASLGCSMGSFPATGSAPVAAVPAVALQGGVQGGQQPVAGAKVQLYAVGAPAAPTSGGATGGYGQGAVALMATPTTTDVGGNWSITGTYDCSTLADPSTPVYIVATGGNPTPANTASIGSINNQYIALMASLGPCNGLTPSMHILLNEVTTVAAVWAMQQFLPVPDGVHAASSYAAQGGATAGAGVNIGAPSGPVGGYGGVQSAVVGLRNASTMVDNLADWSTGMATPRNSWATPWSDKIYTIANILAACVNSDPTASTTCSDLMSAATPAGANAPLDTIQAAYYMARNPTNNVQALTTYASAFMPFPSKLAAPTDFSVVTGLAPYSSGTTYALSSATAAAFDAYGRLWVANLGIGTSTKPYVVELDANGKFLAGPFSTYTATGGYQATSGTNHGDPCPAGTTHTLSYSSAGPKSVVIDQGNVVWISNGDETAATGCNASNSRTVMRILGSGPDGTGAAISDGRYSIGVPYAMTVDTSNNVWIAASSGPIANFINASTSYAAGSLNIGSSPQSAATDMAGNVWFDSGKGCGASTGILYQVGASSSSSPAVTAGYHPTGAGTCALATVNTASTIVNTSVTSIATDARSGIWEMNNYSGANSVTYDLPSATGWTIASGGTVASSASLTSSASVGGLNAPYAVGVDGSNRAWVGNNSGTTLSVLSATVDPSAGITGIVSALPQSMVGGTAYNGINFPSGNLPFQKGVKGTLVDPSGNVWLLNSNTTTSITWTTVVVGAATPVVTPLAYQTQFSRVGQAPQ